MASSPLLTVDELIQFLGGSPDPDLCQLIVDAVSAAVAALVDQPAEDAPWPPGAHLAAVGVAADAYKSLSAPGGGYQLDEVTYSDAFRLTSSILRRYEPFLNPDRAVGGMAG